MILKPKWLTKIEPGHRFSKGLVGAWLFNEGGGDLAYDYSGNGNHGTLVGDTHSVPGKFGPALDFDGTGDYVDLGDSVVWDNLETEGTISTWIRPTSIPLGAAYNYPISRRSSGENSWYLTLNGQTDKLEFISSAGTLATLAAPMPIANVWLHIIVIWSPSAGAIIVDNVVEDSNAGGTVGTGSAKIYIGDAERGDREFDGQIGSVLIYNRTLSAGEIKELYRDPFQMFKRNL